LRRRYIKKTLYSEKKRLELIKNYDLKLKAIYQVKEENEEQEEEAV
jgi:hypothetical protein